MRPRVPLLASALVLVSCGAAMASPPPPILHVNHRTADTLTVSVARNWEATPLPKYGTFGVPLVAVRAALTEGSVAFPRRAYEGHCTHVAFKNYWNCSFHGVDFSWPHRVHAQVKYGDCTCDTRDWSNMATLDVAKG